MKTTTLCFPLVLLACAPTPESCEEVRSEIGFDDPGPAGTTPRMAMQPTEGVRTGTLTWAEAGAIGQLTPNGTTTAITVETTLDMNSAIAIDQSHLGEGRLACVDSIVMQAMFTISTDDGALLESFTIELEAKDGVIGGVVEGRSDLSMHTFDGTLGWQPAESSGELFVRTSWVADQAGTLRGWLIWGDSELVEVTGTEVEGEGVGLVLAQFEATLE